MIPERDYILLMDVGNTFLKWGLFRPRTTARRARTGWSRATRCSRRSPRSRRSSRSSHARAHRHQQCRRHARARQHDPHARGVAGRARAYWLLPQDAQCGVVNSYRNPPQLGSDRWAALIGARHLLGERPAMVVVCGTATTIDFLTGEGVFKGGVIMPGVGLMLRSLHEGTAALPDQGGEFFSIRRKRSTRSRAAASTRRPARSSACSRTSSACMPDVRVHPVRRRGRRRCAPAVDPVPASRQPGDRGPVPGQPVAMKRSWSLEVLAVAVLARLAENVHHRPIDPRPLEVAFAARLKRGREHIDGAPRAAREVAADDPRQVAPLILDA